MARDIQNKRYKFPVWPRSLWGRLAMYFAVYAAFALFNGDQILSWFTAVWTAIAIAAAILVEVACRFQYAELHSDELYLRNATRIRTIPYERIDSVHLSQKGTVEVRYESTTPSGEPRARRVHLRPERADEFRTELRTRAAFAKSQQP